MLKIKNGNGAAIKGKNGAAKQPVIQPVDWYALYRQEMRLRIEEMVRNAGLCEQNSELLYTLAQVVAHPGDADAMALAKDVLESVD